MENLRKFLNNSDNEFLIRIGLVLVGIIFGTCFIILSTLFKNQAAITAFLVFGYATYFSFLAGTGIWYLVENG